MLMYKVYVFVRQRRKTRVFAHIRVHSSHPHQDSAIHLTISFCWPNERLSPVIYNLLNRHRWCSSSSHGDSVVVSEDRDRSVIYMIYSSQLNIFSPKATFYHRQLLPTLNMSDCCGEIRRIFCMQVVGRKGATVVTPCHREETILPIGVEQDSVPWTQVEIDDSLYMEVDGNRLMLPRNCMEVPGSFRGSRQKLSQKLNLLPWKQRPLRLRLSLFPSQCIYFHLLPWKHKLRPASSAVSQLPQEQQYLPWKKKKQFWPVLALGSCRGQGKGQDQGRKLG